jgi:hypothetical protein
MSPRHHVYLIPGFFGFANLGRLRYFVHVHDFLARRCAARGVPVAIHVVRTHPTSSLPLRAARVAEAVARTLRGRGAVAHLIGHSTGGLDARLFATPGVSLPAPIAVERYAQRVQSVITVATPHFGTPLAAALATMQGPRVLALLSLGTSYVLRFGHLPVAVAMQVGEIFRNSALFGRRHMLIDELSQRLLADFSAPRRRAVQNLLAEVVHDQSLLLQVTPESMDVFNAVVRDRPETRYFSVVTRSRPPGIGSTLAAGLDPAAQAMHGVYQTIYRLAAATPAGRAFPLSAPNRRVLRRAYGTVPRTRANDGIVPTRAQVWGEVLEALQADHLDVIGHFNDAAARPPHFDWLTTGSGFDRRQFEALWDAVIDRMVGAARGAERHAPASPHPAAAPRAARRQRVDGKPRA